MPPNDRRDPLISGPPKFRWPWDRAKDVNIGEGTRAPSDSIDQPAGFRMPEFKAPAGVGVRRPAGVTGAPSGWKVLLVRLAIIAAIACHAAPALAWITGPEDARDILAVLGKLIPDIAGVDVGHWYAFGGAAWLWQPRMAIVGAFLLRLAAFNAARRDPSGAIWIAATALAIDTATWVFAGTRLSGVAFSPEEGAALVALLKVEGGVLLALFFVTSPGRRRKPGEGDAGVDRG